MCCSQSEHSTAGTLVILNTSQKAPRTEGLKDSDHRGRCILHTNSAEGPNLWLRGVFCYFKITKVKKYCLKIVFCHVLSFTDYFISCLLNTFNCKRNLKYLYTYVLYSICLCVCGCVCFPLKLAKRYGNIYSIFLGTRCAVIINGVCALKESTSQLISPTEQRSVCQTSCAHKRLAPTF